MAISKKTLILQLALLSLFVFSSYAIRKNSAKLTPVVDDLTVEEDPFMKGICTAGDRCLGKMCPMFISEGCICYNNGTCVSGWVNKCTDCSNPDVFAVLEGQECPARAQGLCAPRKQGLLCMTLAVNSCVCTVDGQCHMEETNSCSKCKDTNVLAVFQGKSCPSKRLSCRDPENCDCDDHKCVKKRA